MKEPIKVITRPTVKEAIKWTCDNYVEVLQWVGPSFSEHISRNLREEILRIHTLEGTMIANKGDWIIRGVEGEYYPCKPDVFLKTYERVY